MTKEANSPSEKIHSLKYSELTEFLQHINKRLRKQQFNFNFHYRPNSGKLLRVSDEKNLRTEADISTTVHLHLKVIPLTKDY